MRVEKTGRLPSNCGLAGVLRFAFCKTVVVSVFVASHIWRGGGFTAATLLHITAHASSSRVWVCVCVEYFSGMSTILRNHLNFYANSIIVVQRSAFNMGVCMCVCTNLSGNYTKFQTEFVPALVYSNAHDALHSRRSKSLQPNTQQIVIHQKFRRTKNSSRVCVCVCAFRSSARQSCSD